MSRIEKITNWHETHSKAFITQQSGDGQYCINLKFSSLAEMHDAFNAMSELAAMAGHLAKATPTQEPSNE